MSKDYIEAVDNAIVHGMKGYMSGLKAMKLAGDLYLQGNIDKEGFDQMVKMAFQKGSHSPY